MDKIICTGNILRNKMQKHLGPADQVLSTLLQTSAVPQEIKFYDISNQLRRYDRRNVEISAKLYVHTANADVDSALKTLFAAIGVQDIDTLTLAYHPIDTVEIWRKVPPLIRHTGENLETLKRYWVAMEDHLSEDRCSYYGLADVDAATYAELYENSVLAPCYPQVHSAYATAIPSNMAEYIKDHSFDLEYHRDPEIICPQLTLNQIGHPELKPVWALRYGVRRKGNVDAFALSCIIGVNDA